MEVGGNVCCFKRVQVKKRMSLPPSYIGRVSEGVIEHLNGDILQYSKELGGVILSYSNPMVQQRLGCILDEQPRIHFDLHVTYCLFAPKIGDLLWGKVNKLGEDHVGCLVNDCFNASVQNRESFLSGMNGYRQPELDDMLPFRVTDLETAGGILAIRGEPHNKTESSKKKKKKKHKEADREKAATPMQSSSLTDQTQASISEQSDSTLLSCTEQPSSKKKKHKNKRKLSDGGLQSDDVQVKHKKHKSSTSGAQKEFTDTLNDAHNDSLLLNSKDKFYKRKHKKFKN